MTSGENITAEDIETNEQYFSIDFLQIRFIQYAPYG